MKEEINHGMHGRTRKMNLIFEKETYIVRGAVRD